MYFSIQPIYKLNQRFLFFDKNNKTKNYLRYNNILNDYTKGTYFCLINLNFLENVGCNVIGEISFFRILLEILP